MEVFREALIREGRGERSDLLVKGLRSGPGPEVHYDVFIREVTGSDRERLEGNGKTLRATETAGEFEWVDRSERRRERRAKLYRETLQQGNLEQVAGSERGRLWSQISRELGERDRRKRDKYRCCPELQTIGLSESGVQWKRAREALQAFGQGLTDWDRRQVRERLSVELV